MNDRILMIKFFCIVQIVLVNSCVTAQKGCSVELEKEINIYQELENDCAILYQEAVSLEKSINHSKNSYSIKEDSDLCDLRFPRDLTNCYDSLVFISNFNDDLRRSNDRIRSYIYDIKHSSEDTEPTAIEETISNSGVISDGRNSYDYVLINSDEHLVGLFLTEEGLETPLNNFKNLNKLLSKRGFELVLATNGGMFEPDFSPTGLLISDSKKIKEIDRRESLPGRFLNFYIQPNGVFYVKEDNTFGIVPTGKYSRRLERTVIHATQSGPMLLVDGVINSNLNAGSPNKFVRSGIGLIDENNILFLISKQRVNFHSFASMFLEFGCKNALYLDGAISKLYYPPLKKLDSSGSFGPIIGVYRKDEK